MKKPINADLSLSIEGPRVNDNDVLRKVVSSVSLREEVMPRVQTTPVLGDPGCVSSISQSRVD